MTNYELIQILHKFPLEMNVQVFELGKSKLKDIKQIYCGNEQYLPGGRKNQPDAIVIEIKNN